MDKKKACQQVIYTNTMFTIWLQQMQARDKIHNVLKIAEYKDPQLLDVPHTIT